MHGCISETWSAIKMGMSDGSDTGLSLRSIPTNTESLLVRMKSSLSSELAPKHHVHTNPPHIPSESVALCVRVTVILKVLLFFWTGFGIGLNGGNN